MARYCNGRTAIVETIAIEPRPDGLIFGGDLVAWETLARADDGGGAVVLKRTPDTGERIELNPDELETLKTYAPVLISKKGLRREGFKLVFGLSATAAALAALLLIGAPLQAEAISHVLPNRYRDHLAAIGWNQINAISTPCAAPYDEPGMVSLNAMFRKLREQGRSIGDARLDLVEAPFANAFTLPDNTIVLTTGMIEMAQSPDEIAGVLAHELGHIEARHVLTNLVRQMSLGLFVDVVFGGSGAAQMAAALNVVALRFSRADETEADAIGLRILNSAYIDPGAMAKLFRRMAAQEAKGGPSVPELLRSHPDTGARATEAEKQSRSGRPPALDAESWGAVKRLCAAPARR